MKERNAELLRQAESVGRQSGLDEKLTRYREKRKAYEGVVRGKDGQRGASLPARRETAAGPRRGAKVFVGDELFS